MNANKDNTNITILPDDTAVIVMKTELPRTHWLYMVEPNNPPSPTMNQGSRQDIIKAMRWAIRASTNNGMDMNFDPDAMVMNMCYALMGSDSSVKTK